MFRGFIFFWTHGRYNIRKEWYTLSQQLCLLLNRSGDATGTSKHSAVSPTAGTKFPRGISSRRTFHGQIPGHRSSGVRGGISDGTADTQPAFGNQSSRLSFLNKLTSKFARR